jgi:prepilin-type N-terminal cleavage/methylation domain-containing protein
MNFNSASQNSLMPRIRRGQGFTLLEMLVALSAFVFLMGGIFAIAQGTLELSNDIGLAQEKSQIRQNFIEFIRRSFRSLPGEAEVRLSVRAKGGTYVPTLNFVNGGSSFTPGTSLPPDTSIDLYAEERPGGYLRVMVRVLDEKQTQALRSNQNVRYTRDQITMPLLDNVSRFEWRFFDASTNRWENNWKQGRRPLMAEMNLQLDDGFETRAVFWLPPIIPNAVNMVGTPGVPGLPGVPGGPGTGQPGLPVDPNNPNALNPPNSPSPVLPQ